MGGLVRRLLFLSVLGRDRWRRWRRTKSESGATSVMAGRFHERRRVGTEFEVSILRLPWTRHYGEMLTLFCRILDVRVVWPLERDDDADVMQ